MVRSVKVSTNERMFADLQRLNTTIVAIEKKIAEQYTRVEKRAVATVPLSIQQPPRTLLNQFEDSLDLFKRFRRQLIALLADSAI